MSRPPRLELLAKFFPEMQQPMGSSGDREASIRFNTLACEAILQDQINLFDFGRQRLGPGVLVNRLQKGSTRSDYITQDDLQVDRDQASKDGLGGLVRTLDAVLEQIESVDVKRFALILLIDNSSMRLLPIDRAKPSGDIQALIEEFTT